MTIKPGQPWGHPVARPADLFVAQSDAELASALVRSPGSAVGVGGGDLARTLGVTPARAASLTAQEMVNEYPIDLLEVRLDDGEASIVAVAHVVARSPLTRGGRLRGRILAVMNAEFLGTWDLAPRGHPNDGRVEVVEVDPSMSIRDRLHARGRLPTGTHVPHPSITTRSIRSASWRFEPALDVVVDGRRVGRASSMSIDVAADAASVYG